MIYAYTAFRYTFRFVVLVLKRTQQELETRIFQQLIVYTESLCPSNNSNELLPSTRWNADNHRSALHKLSQCELAFIGLKCNKTQLHFRGLRIIDRDFGARPSFHVRAP